jgi:carbonic anhydrase
MVKYYILFAIILLVLASAVNSQEDYRKLYTSSMTCKMGRLQSPLNLADSLSSYNSTINPIYLEYRTIDNAYIYWSSEGRVLEIKAVNDTGNFGFLGFSRGGVIKQYALRKIQISYPAEHSIEGYLPQAEIKLVHEKMLGYQTAVDQYRSIPDANSYLTISLLFSTLGNSTDNGFMDLILSNYMSRSSNITISSTISIDLLSYRLFLDRRFFFYEGSFTSTPCDETVNYLVIKDLFTLSPEANTILSGAYSKFTNSQANKLQAEYFGRKVYRNYMLQSESLSAYCIGLNRIFILLLVALII